MEADNSRGAEQGWINVVIPQLNGKIHLSYKPVKDNLELYITDSRTLVYKHTVKAQGIEESPFIHRDQRRFGMVYDLREMWPRCSVFYHRQHASLPEGFALL